MRRRDPQSALSLLARGQFERAEAELKRAQETDPLSYPTAHSLGEAYYYWRRSDRLIEQVRAMLELNPDDINAYRLLARAHMQKGMYEEALEANGRAGHDKGERAFILAVAGRRDEALRLTEELMRSDLAVRRPFSIACLYAALGETETAFVWLQRAYDTRQADLASIKIDPALDPIRSDPRYVELVRRVGLAEEEANR